MKLIISVLFILLSIFNYACYAGAYDVNTRTTKHFEVGYGAGAVDYTLFKNDIGNGVRNSSKSSTQFASRLHLSYGRDINSLINLAIEVGENYFSTASTQTNNNRRTFKQQWVTDLLLNLKLQNESYYIKGQSGMAFVPLNYRRYSVLTNQTLETNSMTQWAVEYGAGLGKYINNKINVEFSYRHIDGVSDSGMNIGANTLAMNTLLLGINYMF